MATKIQDNAFILEYQSVIDLNISTSNDTMRPLYHEGPIPKSGPFAAQIHKNGYFGYDIEKTRQTILEHESIFKIQLQELHRLYGRQRELMNEMRRIEIKKYEFNNKCLPILPPPQDTRSLTNFAPRFFTSGIFPKGTDNICTGNNKASYDRDTNLSTLGFDLDFKRTDLCSGFNVVMKDYFQTSQSGKEHLSEEYAVNFAEPRKELSHCPYMGTSVSRKKKKIFGVEISEGDEYPFNSASYISSTFDPKTEPRVSFKPSSWVANSCMQNGKKERSTTDLEVEISSQKGFSSTGLNFANVSYEEKSKSGLPWFLKNRSANDDVSKMKKSSYIMNLDSLQNYSEKFFGKAENAEDKFQSLKEKMENFNRKADLRPHIDLNLSLDEDNAMSDIDLWAPPVVESELCYEECDKIAAEAIIDISSSKKQNYVDDKSCDECLKWFADIIISSNRSGPHSEIESIPEGMDYFEFMTLKLEDIKESVYIVENPIIEGENGRRKLSKRAPRGRQQRDFQRDILPGLVTLSRLEVTEDFQAFEELLKGEDPSKQGPTRNFRRRKRSGRAQQAVCRVEERSLTGWGKRTRRLPRQRCASAFLGVPVKC
ncbi:hypothetical protein CASFOL_026636 [Castilleja foliolosa]|uniref:Uncharacterized protein n=1 Tax=Castilleja foliolosa TaxID=1961234 RepID=A0ABD3CIP0_9LAMI